MNKRFTAIVMLLLCNVALSTPSTTQADDIILQHGGIQITLEEAFAYSLSHTNPDAYVASISKSLATYRVLQNLYTLKRVAALVEASSYFSATDLQYLMDDFYRRRLLEQYVGEVLSERMAEIDWQGLAKAEYAQRKADFISPEKVRVEHLLVSMENLLFDDFVARVREVESQVNSENDFSDLIAQYSDDPSAARNDGDLGYFSRESMQPAFADAAFNLTEPGEIVGPVMTQFGAHFLRFIDRKEEQSSTFGELEGRLINQIKKDTQARLREEILTEIRDEIDPELIEIDESALLERFLQAYELHKETLQN